MSSFLRGEVKTYDKRHLFPLSGEDKSFTPGETVMVFSIKGWRFSPFICYDLRFPSWVRNRSLAYDCLIFSANWPAPRILHWDILLRARAIENMSYCIGVNRIGIDGNATGYNGHSAAFGPRGEELAFLGEGEGACVVTLNRDEIDLYREQFPYWRDADETVS